MSSSSTQSSDTKHLTAIGNDERSKHQVVTISVPNAGHVQRNPFPRCLWVGMLISAVFIYGLYPIYVRCSKVDNEIKYSTASLVLLIEFGKLLFSVFNLFPKWRKGQVENQPLIVWFAYSVPAMLYCFSNNITILVQKYIDPASYMIISNLKIPTTAILYRLIIKRPLTWLKWFAVVLLTAAGVFNSLGNLVSDDNLKEHTNVVYVTMTGLLILMVYCVVSAFAGIWSELIVKKQFEVSIHQQNFMLYFFGVLFNLIAFFWMETKSPNLDSEGGSAFFWRIKYFFHDFNIWVVIIICSEIYGGLVISAILKYASNITRLFMTSAAMVVTTLISFALFDFVLNFYLIGSLSVVILALYLYNHD